MKSIVNIIISLVCFCIVAVFTLFIWMRFIEPNIIKIEKLNFNFESFEGKFSALHLTDLHSKSFGRKEKEILKIIDKTQPDFIFLTGDIVDWITKDLDSCYIFWQELVQKNKGRVFAVLGNHEHRNPQFLKIVSLLSQSEIKVLDNEWKEIKVDEASFYLIGVDDPHLGFDDLGKAMIGLPENSIKILLAHSPEIFRKTENQGIDIILTGHTHGCQINIPFICDKIIPLKYDKQYRAGLFEKNGTFLYVNRGIGETFLPLRLNAFPEATLLKINF